MIYAKISKIKRDFMDKKRFLREIKNFFVDHPLLHYSASLSFHTLLSLIPMLLISFYIFTRFHIFEKYMQKAKDFIFSFIIPTNKELIANNIEQFMTNTSHLGLIGFIFVIYVSVMFFDDFEYVVNKIFHAKPRSFFHSILLYFTISLLVPMMFGLSIFLSIKAKIFVSFNSSFISYIMIWGMFFLLYQVAANVKVSPKAALISSFITSIVWNLSKYLFVLYITYNKTYSTIYGSFSVVMFFLIWLYISWIIFLYGVKFCYILNQIFLEEKDQK